MKELTQQIQAQQKQEEYMKLLEEARYYERRIKEYPVYEPPKEFIENMYKIAFIKEIYCHHFGTTVYYIPDPSFYTDEMPMLIIHDYGGENECFSVGITHKETVEEDLEAFFYANLYKWIRNTGDPLYIWLLEKIKETTVDDLESFLKRVEGYEVYVLNPTEEKYKEMLKWQASFDMIVYLIREEYYENIKRREHLIMHKLNRKPILPPEESIIVERLGLLDERYFQFDWWDDESRKLYLQEKLLDLVKIEYLRKGLHLSLYCYTDDLIKAMRKTFPEWFVER